MSATELQADLIKQRIVIISVYEHLLNSKISFSCVHRICENDRHNEKNGASCNGLVKGWVTSSSWLETKLGLGEVPGRWEVDILIDLPDVGRTHADRFISQQDRVMLNISIPRSSV